MLQVEPTSHSGPVAIKSGRNISEAEKNLMAIGGGHIASSPPKN